MESEGDGVKNFIILHCFNIINIIHSDRSEFLLVGGILGHLQKLIQVYSIPVDVVLGVEFLHHIYDLVHGLINSIDFLLDPIDDFLLGEELVLIHIVPFEHILQLSQKLLIGFKASCPHTQKDECK